MENCKMYIGGKYIGDCIVQMPKELLSPNHIIDINDKEMTFYGTIGMRTEQFLGIKQLLSGDN